MACPTIKRNSIININLLILYTTHVDTGRKFVNDRALELCVQETSNIFSLYDCLILWL